MPVLHYIFQVLKVLLIQSHKMQPPVLLFIVVLHQLLLADIVFYNFLELHLTLSEKIFLSQIFLSLQIHQNPPHPLNNQNLLGYWFV